MRQHIRGSYCRVAMRSRDEALAMWKRADRDGYASRSVTLELGEGDALPTEFKLFVPGRNDSTKGPAVFDDVAAESVMSAFRKQGVDVMIDLEHLSTDDEARNYDPDARGWCKLELRKGELWAVDVRWTPDGEARLKERRQRYVSPWFKYDKQLRVREILNVALCGMPATYQAEPLVAAKRSKMDPAQIKAALDAIESGDEGKALEILKGLIASAAGGGAPADPPAEDLTRTDTPPVSDEDKDAVMAATSRLNRITGKDTISAAVDEVETWRKSHLELESEKKKLADDRAKLESAERRKLVGELVKLGNEIPATAWSDDKGSVPCKRLQDEPIGDLRDRVQKLTAARGKTPPKDPTPPTPEENHGLTERELELCKRKKIDPAEYAKTRAGIRSRAPSTTNA